MKSKSNDEKAEAIRIVADMPTDDAIIACLDVLQRQLRKQCGGHDCHMEGVGSDGHSFGESDWTATC